MLHSSCWCCASSSASPAPRAAASHASSAAGSNRQKCTSDSCPASAATVRTAICSGGVVRTRGRWRVGREVWRQERLLAGQWPAGGNTHRRPQTLACPAMSLKHRGGAPLQPARRREPHGRQAARPYRVSCEAPLRAAASAASRCKRHRCQPAPCAAAATAAPRRGGSDTRRTRWLGRRRARGRARWPAVSRAGSGGRGAHRRGVFR